MQSQDYAEEVFWQYATELGLDMDQFNKDLNSKDVIKAVAKDLNSGNDIGIYRTPSFFLNGELMDNPRTYEEFRTIIREAIQASS